MICICIVSKFMDCIYKVAPLEARAFVNASDVIPF